MGRQPLPTNTVLGTRGDHYRIDTVIGPGGFGITYLARDLRSDREVAIKEYFPAEFAFRDGSMTIRSSTLGTANDFFEQGKRHFQEEARTLGKFRHPNIVRMLEVFEQFNTAYMVLEFEEGQNLKAWLQLLGRRPTQAEIDRILEPMLSALELIHSKGMFHRDIAPDNIIVRPDGLPVLIDFGAARNFVREHSFTVGAIVKHGYSPPEQYTLDTRLQGAWSDIYSLSATLYFAIVGEPPVEAAKRHLSDTMLPIHDRLDPTVAKQYRPSFIDALEAGLALRPKDRPATIAEWRIIYDERPRPRREPATEGTPRRRVGLGQIAAAAALGDTFGATKASGRDGHTRGARDAVPGGARSRALPGEARAVAAQATADRSGLAAAIATSPGYPEQASRVAGLIALLVGGIAAISFLAIGGIEHPGGLAAASIACAALIVTCLERALAVARTGQIESGRAAAAAAVMSSLAFAVYWLPLFLWPVSAVLVGAAILFVVAGFGRWVPPTLMTLGIVHFAVAGLLLMLALRSEQKDPFFLPLMGFSLAVLAGLVLVSAFSMQRHWEPAL